MKPFRHAEIEGSLKVSTSVMKDVDSSVELPELIGAMRELSQELMRAGVLEEIVGNILPGGGRSRWSCGRGDRKRDRQRSRRGP